MRIGIIHHDSTQRSAVVKKMASAAINGAEFSYVNMRSMNGSLWVPKPKTKASYMRTEDGEARLNILWPKLCEKFDAFICIDVAMAHYFLPEEMRASLRGKDPLEPIGGMIVSYLNDTPVLFLSDPLKCYGKKFKAEENAAFSFQTMFHLFKLRRKLLGMPAREKPVKICIPVSKKELKMCEEMAAQSTLIAADVETAGNYISCCGFACENPKSDYVFVFVLPFYMNTKTTDEGMFWKNDYMFQIAHETMQRVLANPVPKIMHNGSYDCTFFLRYRLEVNNFIYDTQHMMHAMFPTMKKALYSVSAMFCGNYRYWKDDAKDVSSDTTKEKSYMPTTIEGHMKYWNYNGADCANTLEICIAMLEYWTANGDHPDFPRFVPGLKYVWRNYIREFAVQFGPCMYMSMTGMKGSREIQGKLAASLRYDAKKYKKELGQLVCDPDINPNSAPQVQRLYYDIMLMPPDRRKGRTTDKKIMQSIANMHPIFARVINAVAKAKEPANNVSKYAELPLWKNKWMMYNLKTSTTTSRLASAKHNYKVGTNFQNFPKPMRIFGVATDKEVLVSSDYSQSDSYFVAFESQDQTMINTVTNDKDTHAEHVEFFFGHDYDKVVKGNNDKADWVVHPVTGVRQIIKKVSHGTNYDMGGETMLMNVQKPAAIAMTKALMQSKNAAKLIAYTGVVKEKLIDASGLTTKVLQSVCSFSQALYYERYKTLAKWKKIAVSDATLKGGLIEMFGGTTTVMLCKPEKNARYVPAAYGQGGTAGNINNAMLRLYYLNDDMWQQGYRLTLQVHDEIVSSIPVNALHLAAQQKQIMETPCTIHGRSFTIPVSAEISLIWSEKSAVEYQEGVDMIGLAAEKTDKILQELDVKSNRAETELMELFS